MLTYTLPKCYYTRTNTTVTGADVTSGLSVLAESARLRKYVSTKKINNYPCKMSSYSAAMKRAKKQMHLPFYIQVKPIICVVVSIGR